MNVSAPQQSTSDLEIRKGIESLIRILPDFDFTPRESGEIDFYGASDLIARQLGLPKAPFTPLGPTWIHGWSGAFRSWLARRPDSLSDQLRKQHVCLVDHPRLEGYLREQGFAHARAIG